jgi:hypothetical protein
VVLVKTDVSEEPIAPVISVKIISALGTLAVTSNPDDGSYTFL